MIGINFNEDNMAQLIHGKPEETDINFDIVIDSLPPKDESKSDTIEKLYKDSDDNLYWKYVDKPLTDSERLQDIELALAEILGNM
ncbi:MAG: hypothetical protein ACOCQD_02625 [archaeon]